MDKTDIRETVDLIKAYHQIGGILQDRLKRNAPVIPASMGGLISSLRSHTSLINHTVSNIHSTIIEDVPSPDRDKYEVEVSCGIHFIVEGVKTRKEAVDQVESGYYDERIGALLAEALGECRFRKVERIRTVDEEEENGGA